MYPDLAIPPARGNTMNMTNLKAFILTLIIVPSLNAAAAGFDADFYHRRYGLTDTHTKLVDDHGDGYEALYGVRNMREVLKGVLYRGGANNLFNKYGKRRNQNPLPKIGLDNLCKEGFAYSFYMYTTNFKTDPPQVSCRSIRGDNTLNYLQLSFNKKQKEMLTLIRAAILDSSKGPIYLHCWNGWHASGYMSALALRQFCGVSVDTAIAYWNANTDGVNGPGYDKIRKAVAAFQPYAELNVDVATQQRICPDL